MKSLLLTEDEPIFVQKFKLLFKMSGICGNLEVCRDAAKLVKEYKQGEYDAVLVDIGVDSHNGEGSVTGIDLLRYIKKDLGNGVAAGIISTSNNPAHILAAQRAGGNFYMLKGGMELKDRLEKFRKDFLDVETPPEKFIVYD